MSPEAQSRPYAFALPVVRLGPSVGEVGCVGACPLCTTSAGHPPCLACRDELRARLRDYEQGAMPDPKWN